VTYTALNPLSVLDIYEVSHMWARPHVDGTPNDCVPLTVIPKPRLPSQATSTTSLRGAISPTAAPSACWHWVHYIRLW